MCSCLRENVNGVGAMFLGNCTFVLGIEVAIPGVMVNTGHLPCHKGDLTLRSN